MGPTRFDNLQALRGVACLLVVVYHTADIEELFGLGFSPLAPVGWFGFAGVDLFFVLSGFLITATCRHRFGRPDAVPNYLFRRAWRIYPTYWAALALVALHNLWSNPTGLRGFAESGVLIDHLLILPGPDGGGPKFIPIAWTLSFELMFYATFASLLVLPRRFAPWCLAGWALAVCGVTAGGFVPSNRFAALALSPYVLEFLAGAAIALTGFAPRGRAALAAAAVGILWVVAGVALSPFDDPKRLASTPPVRVAIFGPGVALILAAAVGRERSGHAVRGRWLAALGDASYSIYLIHCTAILVVLYLTMSAGLSHSRGPHLSWIALTIGGSLAAGWVLHRLVERPLLGLVKGRRHPTGHEPRPDTAMPADEQRRAA